MGVVDLALELSQTAELSTPSVDHSPGEISFFDELLTMPPSSRSEAKQAKRAAQGKPPHKIRAWSLAELQAGERGPGRIVEPFWL